MNEDFDDAVKAAIDAARAELEDMATVLFPTDLTEKYGFGDGDIADEIVYAWAEQSWVAQLPGALVEGEYVEHPVNSYCNSRVMLALAIRDVLLPTLTLPEGATVHRVNSVHNPFYLTVGGEYVTEEAAPTGAHAQAAAAFAALKAADPVVLTTAQAHQLCEQAYPPRPLGWLRLHEQLTWVYQLMEMLPEPVEPILRMNTLRVGALIDAYAAILDDEILGLAAELLLGGEVVHSLNQLEPAEMLDAITEALTVAQAAAGTRRVSVPHAGTVINALPPAGLLPAIAPTPKHVRTRSGKAARPRRDGPTGRALGS